MKMIEFSRIEKVAHERGFRITDDGALLFRGESMPIKVGARGYRFFYIRRNGKCCQCLHHRLQAYQKYGDLIYQQGIEVRHLNSNKNDNSYSNIAIGTRRDNIHDRPKDVIEYSLKRMRQAQMAAGTAGNGRKIDDDDKIKIRKDRASGMSYKQLKQKYGYSIGGLVYTCLYAKDSQRFRSDAQPHP